MRRNWVSMLNSAASRSRFDTSKNRSCLDCNNRYTAVISCILQRDATRRFANSRHWEIGRVKKCKENEKQVLLFCRRVTSTREQKKEEHCEGRLSEPQAAFVGFLSHLINTYRSWRCVPRLPRQKLRSWCIVHIMHCLRRGAATRKEKSLTKCMLLLLLELSSWPQSLHCSSIGLTRSSACSSTLVVDFAIKTLQGTTCCCDNSR